MTGFRNSMILMILAAYVVSCGNGESEKPKEIDKESKPAKQLTPEEAVRARFDEYMKALNSGDGVQVLSFLHFEKEETRQQLAASFTSALKLLQLRMKSWEITSVRIEKDRAFVRAKVTRSAMNHSDNKRETKTLHPQREGEWILEGGRWYVAPLDASLWY